MGKNLIEVLAGEYKIIVVDKIRDEEFLRSHNDVKYYQHDFSDASINDLRQIIQDLEPHFVINLVSIVTAERDMSLFPSLISVNLGSLLSLFECLRNSSSLKLFMQIGSAEEYGNTISPYLESYREYPDSPYALVKQLTTNSTLMLFRNYGFPAVVIRPGNLFGKYQNGKKFLPYIINKMVKNERLELTACEQKRDFIYAEDFGIAVLKLLKAGRNVQGMILNVSYGRGVRLKDIVEYIRSKTCSKSEIIYGAMKYRENEMMDFQCDIARLKDITGIDFTRDVFGALDEYIDQIKDTI